MALVAQVVLLSYTSPNAIFGMSASYQMQMRIVSPPTGGMSRN